MERAPRNLEATIPVYDKINRFATFRQVDRWRKMVASRLPADGEILEIGCGPGSFAEILEGRNLTCLDPIQAMLEAQNPESMQRGGSGGIPWQNSSRAQPKNSPFRQFLRCSMHAFSFRDWFDKEPVFPRH